MGLGYRPFWIFGWAALMVLLGAIGYLVFLPNRVNEYLGVNARAINIASPWSVAGLSFGRWSPPRYRHDHLLNTIFSCVYFSTMIFFTFRLKKDILTFFTYQEKRWIIFQWTLGFLVYAAFLTLSKSGSILQQLKTLFVG